MPLRPSYENRNRSDDGQCLDHAFNLHGAIILFYFFADLDRGHARRHYPQFENQTDGLLRLTRNLFFYMGEPPRVADKYFEDLMLDHSDPHLDDDDWRYVTAVLGLIVEQWKQRREN